MNKYIISDNQNVLKSIDLRINNYMKSKDSTYHSATWGIITKHKSKNKWALHLGDFEDKRNPFSKLDQAEILSMVDNLPSDWKPVFNPLN
tara:strand:+ start:480 stop:749 length:270 start_codon:yes stop_codon:yes gene_type:complete